jgi:hypothetical protein
LQPRARIDVLLQNLFRRLRCDLLDIHAACRRRHEYRLAVPAIHQNPDVQLALDRQRLFDQQPSHDASLGPRLVGDQRHAQHLRRKFAHDCHRIRNLHAAALASATRMNLRLHYHARCARAQQVFRDRLRLVARLGHLPARHCDSILLQDCFRLVLMNFHNDSRSFE